MRVWTIIRWKTNIFSDAGFVQILIESIRQNLQGARILLNEALHICEESDGPYLYAEAWKRIL